MIPPLEDEIDDEEEEMMEEGVVPGGGDKPQSPAGKGIPPVEEDLPPLEEASAPAEKERPEEEKVTNTTDKGTETDTKKVAATEGGTPPAEEVEQHEKSPAQEVHSSAAADSATKDGEALSSPKEENLHLPTDKTANPTETQETESAAADTGKEKEG